VPEELVVVLVLVPLVVVPAPVPLPAAPDVLALPPHAPVQEIQARRMRRKRIRRVERTLWHLVKAAVVDRRLLGPVAPLDAKRVFPRGSR
jgi:hypothetical protein